MLLAAFGDAVDPAWLGEAGSGFRAVRLWWRDLRARHAHWQLLQFLLAGGAIAGGIAILKIVVPVYLRSPRPGPHRTPGRCR
jgi:O-antigen ligase